MNDKIAITTKAMEDAVLKAKQNLEGVVKSQQEQVEKATQQLLKGYEDLAVVAKDNVDAVVQSSTIVAKGAEEAGKQIAAFTQASLQQGVATGKAALAVKTIRELVDLQNTYAKQAFDSFVAESSKLQELSVKIANEAFAPLNQRVNATVEKFAKSRAA